MKCERIESVTTYSSISSRMICSSVWSTLMTSSMRRDVVGEERSDGLGPVISRPSEDLRPVVVLGVEHAHEIEALPRRQLARVEEDRRHVHLALELLQER